MKRIACVLLGLALAAPGSAQITRDNLWTILGFENGRAGTYPAGWGGSTGFLTDDQVAHSGKFSARIERTSTSAGTFSTLTLSLPLDFPAQTIEWRGWVRTENVDGYAALWLREDGASGTVDFASTQTLNVNGTRDWQQYSVKVNVTPAGRTLFFGFLLGGTGKAWVDDLEFVVDGQAIGPVLTPLDTDHEFDSGSRIALTNLTGTQIANLATLAKVWGFLKYHHPAVTGGSRHWDYDLFRVLPAILKAEDGTAANQAISAWIANLGPVADCTDCAKLDTGDLYMGPDLDWISDERLLGSDLSQTLRNIHRNRPVAGKQFFVSIPPPPAARNPVFEHEPAYPSLRFPDAGYQLLALFRYWNMVQYFYPARDVMADDPAEAPQYWNNVLTEFIPRVGLAADSFAYQQELMKFIARIHDTHANLWSSIAVRPPLGSCYLPVDVRFVEGRPIILRYTSASAGPASGLMPGDLIEQLDGVAVNDLVAQWRPIYADSNEAARMRDIGRYMMRGACGPASVAVRRGDDLVTANATRLPAGVLDFSLSYVHELPGDAFQMLSTDVAYIKISTAVSAQSASYIEAAAGTKGLIIDIRNYPSDFPVFSLGELLVSKPTNFAWFTNGDVANPGAFHWGDLMTLIPKQPHYAGKVVILVDEVTQSSAEYHAMAFRSARGAIVIGSTTAGADGNVSTILLPGGLSSYFSGLGTFYADKRPAQRVGIVPDLVVKPTIAGIRAGRDELIEAAIRQIVDGGKYRQ